MKNIIMYPTINDDYIENAGIKVIYDNDMDYWFMYKKDNRNVRLSYEKDGQVYYLKDDKYGIWNKDDYDLDIRLAVEIEKPSQLFGIGGLIDEKSKIKAYLKWISDDTHSYGFNYEKNGFILIENTDLPIKKGLQVIIPKKYLGENIQVELVFIASDCSNLNDKTPLHLQHKNGDILGSMFQLKVVLSGEGSDFPVVSKSLGSNEPLWFFDLSYVDPSEELLTKDNFCLYLNTDHKHYSLLEIDNIQSISPLFIEIFSTAMAQVIIDLKMKGFLSNIKHDDVNKGTILDAILYFIDTFNINTNSIEDIMKSVKKEVGVKLSL